MTTTTVILLLENRGTLWVVQVVKLQPHMVVTTAHNSCFLPERVKAMKEVGAWDNPERKKAMIENFIKYDRANGAR
jgi:hypothetical protein